MPHATALVVGTIVGASIFVQPSEITGIVHTTQGTILVWLASGLLTLFGALICAELASIYTQTGGVYIYLREAFSPAVGFLWGWAMFWSMHSGIIAAIAVIFARYCGFFIPLSDMGLKTVAISVILVHSLINFFGVRHGSNLQMIFTIGKVVAIALIILFGLVLGAEIPAHFESGSLEGTSTSLNNIMTAMIAGLFAFGGWHMVTYNAEETVDPQSTIPKSLILGTVIVTVCYVALNTVYMYILPLDAVASSSRIAADAANALLGSGGGAFMSALVMFSTFGAIGGIVLIGPRVYYSMANDGLLFKWIGDIHPTYRTPYKAILLQALWSSALVWTGTYRELFTRVIFTEWIFFGLMGIGLFIVRKRRIERQYSIIGYPVVPAIFIVASFVIVANHLFNKPVEGISGLALLLAGLIIYYIVNPKKKINKPEHDH